MFVSDFIVFLILKDFEFKLKFTFYQQQMEVV